MLFSLPVPTWQLLMAGIQEILSDFQVFAQCHYFTQHLAEQFFFLPKLLRASSLQTANWVASRSLGEKWLEGLTTYTTDI